MIWGTEGMCREVQCMVRLENEHLYHSALSQSCILGVSCEGGRTVTKPSVLLGKNFVGKVSLEKT